MSDHVPMPFQLDKQFVDKFRGRQPPFGFNGLGEFVYRRSYSRVKEDGQNEEWFETVERVVNGTYSMQKECIEANGLEWKPKKAEKSAEEMYTRIFELKFTPPGRGLWAMGSPLTQKKHLFAALNNCFAGETEIITKEGIKCISDLVGKNVILLSSGGRWIEAPIREFGIQELRKLTIERSGIRREIFTTGNHRWFAMTLSKLQKHQRFREFTTDQLVAGFCLQSVFENKVADEFDDEKQHWNVVSVEKTNRSEVVYCAVVPETRCFALKDNILTGNCAFVSTRNIRQDKAKPFEFLMDGSMLGIGVGFDTEGAGKIDILGPDDSLDVYDFPIPDSREGWVMSVKYLIESYLNHTAKVVFNYNGIRAAGELIKNFGGISSGPGVLRQLHDRIRETLDANIGSPITVTSIVDIMNHIGVCVVSGNVRRTAEIAFGDPNSEEYVDLKNYEKNPQRAAFGWSSNNSVFAKIGMDYTGICDRIQKNGEPGLAWLDNMRKFSRMNGVVDNKDSRAMGGNPCLEQTLENYELCCVSGDTRIMCRDGYPMIQFVEGRRVEVFNGKGWSTVRPFLAAKNKPLYRVVLSDGSYLDVTDNHEWSVRENASSLFSKTRTDALKPGMRLESFALNQDKGTYIMNAVSMGGTLIRKDQSDDSIRCTFNMANKMHKDYVAELFFGAIYYDKLSYFDNIRNFIAIHTTEENARLLQLLGRRCGLNTTKVCECIPLDSSQKPEQPVWALLLKCSELKMALTLKYSQIERPYQRLVEWSTRAPAYEYPSSKYDFSDEQVITEIIPLEGLHDVYCFTEQYRHMGVFGNCLTYQCLVETFPYRHDSIEDFCRTLKFAYLYAKTVTLGKTHWPETNRVLLRNRRIGCSMSGLAQFVAKHGLETLRQWCAEGYKTIENYDKIYSEWLCIANSIKTTSIKPSGCRPKDALTITSEGILTLEELMVGHDTNSEWHDFEKPIVAIQYGFDASKITKTYRNGKTPIYQATLEFGLTVESTGNHLWSVVGKKLDGTQSEILNSFFDEPVWKRMDELEAGDILETNLGMYEKGEQAEYKSADSGEAGQFPKHMTEDMAWFVGLMWACGKCEPRDKALHIMHEKYVVLRGAKDFIDRVFGVIEISIQASRDHGGLWQLSIRSPAFWKWFMVVNKLYKVFYDENNFYISDSHNIPEIIRRSSASDIVSFISGLFDGCGTLVRIINDVNIQPSIIMAFDDLKFAKNLQRVACAVGILLDLNVQQQLSTQSKNDCVCFLRVVRADWQHLSRTFMNKSLMLKKHYYKFSPFFKVSLRDMSRTTGLVLSKPCIIGKDETFDIEVENTHWYYDAGCVKSHNTVSLLAGATPGMHFPISRFYIRRVRIPHDSNMIPALVEAGLHIEPAVGSEETTSVVSFPIDAGEGVRAARDVSMWEQLAFAAFLQEHWSNNQVSCTISFDPETEGPQIAQALEYFQYKLKGVSFLPNDNHNYAQLPYEPISEEEYHRLNSRTKAIRYDLTESVDPDVESFCDGEFCLVQKK